MMGVVNTVVNGLWFLGCGREALAFHWWRRRTAEAQGRILMNILRGNRRSAFGRQHGFSEIRSVREYRDLVPLSGWEDYAALVERLGAGERSLLTEEPVLLFEPTGGSVSGPKLVPYTPALAREFSRGIDTWVFHLFRRHPALLTGCAYFSLTPFGTTARRTSCGIPVGFEDDTAYLGGIMRRIGDRVLAVPRVVASIAEPDAFRYVTLLFLLGRKDLALVSVWNPTFLEILLEKLEGWWERLVSDIEMGRIACAPAMEPGARLSCQKRLKPRGRRASELRRIFHAWQGRGRLHRDDRGRTLYEALWPRLRVISCWADANAEGPALRLKNLFPHVDLQPKGLLSTEAFVSFPLEGSRSAVLSARSHFFEFIDTEHGAVRLAHELSRGGRYEAVVTTGGGLYRYRTRDMIEVTGTWGSVPTFRFIGRTDMVSDMFGEKLAEAHVRSVVSESLRRNGILADFWMIAPETGGPGSSFYALFIQTAAERGTSLEDAVLRKTAVEIDAGFRSNPQYAHCLRLGQLRPLRVFRIACQAAEDFLSTSAERGQRLGDIKPPALHPRAGWATVFRGKLLP